MNVLRVRRMVVKEFRQLFRDPKTKRIIFASPIIQLLAFGYAVNTDVRNVATVVVDHDHSVESRALLDAFTASGYFRIVEASDRPAAIGDALDHGRAVVGLEIPAGYAADLKARRAPAIQLLAFGYAVNTDVRNVATVVVDHDHSVESRALLDAFTASGYFRIVEVSDRPAAIGDALDHGRAVVGLEIPAGYAADLKARRAPAIQLLGDGTNSNTATVAQGYAAEIVQAHGAGLAASLGVRPTGVDLRTRAWFNPSLESRVYNVPAVIGVIVLMMSLMLTALGIVREREVGTLEQLLVSPLSAEELILGKTIPVAGIALLQISVVTAVALLWFGIPVTGSVATLLLAAFFFILAGLSVGVYISTISATQQEAFLSMYMFFLPAIILSGFLYPIHTMSTVFELVTWLNPLRHFLDVVRAVFLKSAGLADVWMSIAILMVMAIAGLTFATRRFRATL